MDAPFAMVGCESHAESASGFAVRDLYGDGITVSAASLPGAEKDSEHAARPHH
jgi:hypothetical protein